MGRSIWEPHARIAKKKKKRIFKCYVPKNYTLTIFTLQYGDNALRVWGYNHGLKTPYLTLICLLLAKNVVVPEWATYTMARLQLFLLSPSGAYGRNNTWPTETVPGISITSLILDRLFSMLVLVFKSFSSSVGSSETNRSSRPQYWPAAWQLAIGLHCL